MKLEKIVSWLDQTLNVAAFDDVSNNGIQIERDQGLGIRDEGSGIGDEGSGIGDEGSGIGDQVKVVAFAVDASVKAVKAAAKAGAQLLVVHHGISWGGGIKRIEGGVYNVVKAAMDANLAIYACHLPLDAHPVLGNNAQLAKLLGLKRVKPAFNYHGNVIGLLGVLEKPEALEALVSLDHLDQLVAPLTLGVCSGGAGEFAVEAKRLGCDLYLTGEASWGDVIAAENCGMEMICAGHYETEVFGVRAVAKAMAKALKLKTVDLSQNGRI